MIVAHIDMGAVRGEHHAELVTEPAAGDPPARDK
jgi:hypothetical protein